MIECQKCYNQAQVAWVNESTEEMHFYCLAHDPLADRTRLAGQGWVRQFHPPAWWAELLDAIQQAHDNGELGNEPRLIEHQGIRGPKVLCERTGCRDVATRQIWTEKIRGIVMGCGECAPYLATNLHENGGGTIHWADYTGVGPRPDTAGKWARKGLGLAAGIAIGAIFGG